MSNLRSNLQHAPLSSLCLKQHTWKGRPLRWGTAFNYLGRKGSQKPNAMRRGGSGWIQCEKLRGETQGLPQYNFQLRRLAAPGIVPSEVFSFLPNYLINLTRMHWEHVVYVCVVGVGQMCLGVGTEGQVTSLWSEFQSFLCEFWGSNPC